MLQQFLSNMLTSFLAMQVAVAIKLGQNGVATISSSGADHLFVFISVYVNGFAWSWGLLGWLGPSKMFPLEIRHAGLGRASMFRLTCCLHSS